MKFKSQIVTAASGSVGGATASRNRFGMYFRARAVPVNSQTSFQQAIRNLFATFASRWTSILTAAQRSGWDTYAANVPVLDALGDARNLTGLNWYAAMNVARRQPGSASLPVVDDAPTTFSQAVHTPVTASYSEASGDWTINYTNTDAWAAAVGGGLLIADSRPFSPSINFFKGPFRYLDVVLGAATPPTSPRIVASTFPLVEGQQAALHVRAVLPDGRISAPQIIRVTAAA